ncbi:hypothetical protein A5714_11750 [Mycobacterium sp. E2462]|uniref:ANTAR domain-containing protein n=1 Tax=unclassified Mycobacterium TaxID=2642494 RepID=UPI0008003F6F|nr:MULTISPECIES: ANTAR domain-containing protein [unclassified Mycobacterium]OBG72216.1 hypothetical protein A5700_09880 [Mycobacterium sp. E1214]OBH31149.1 hypothetical protein A5693_01675 [Mycobacterium sp. E1319]OBI15823.1 hypothetical protein A5714_11750 [Mycobacterium sp. E2462]
MIDGLTSRAPVNQHRRDTTRVLDMAVGILIGWRRCSVDAAFGELINASERHGVGVFAMASGLVALATRHAEAPGAAGNAAQVAAEREWGLNYLL